LSLWPLLFRSGGLEIGSVGAAPIDLVAAQYAVDDSLDILQEEG
jgi:hypothetical protein